MRRLPWIIGAVVVIVVVALIAAPYLYKAVRGGDDAPAATVSVDGAEEATGTLEGTWVVVPGTAPNETTAGYTVNEILRGEPVNVVGSTDQVSGRAVVSGTTLESASFDVQVAGIETDIDQRDAQARSPQILDAGSHPSATLTVAEPVDLAAVPSDGTTVSIPMVVELTIKGTTVREDTEVTVLRTGDALIASGAVPLTWAEVGVEPPSLGFVAVEPSGTIDFLVSLARQ